MLAETFPRGSTTRKCLACDREFTRPNAALRKGHAKYCSRKCHYDHRRGTLLREKNPNWKGGRVMIVGRPCLYIPEHHRAHKSSGYVFEHIVIAEKLVGRPLKYYRHSHSFNEVVHHINGDKTDNSLSNLRVMLSRDHKSLHAKRRRRVS